MVQLAVLLLLLTVIKMQIMMHLKISHGVVLFRQHLVESELLQHPVILLTLMLNHTDYQLLKAASQVLGIRQVVQTAFFH